MSVVNDDLCYKQILFINVLFMYELTFKRQLDQYFCVCGVIKDLGA